MNGGGNAGRQVVGAVLVLALLVGCRSNEATPAPVQVHAAISLADALEDVGRQHAEAGGAPVRFSFGSSGELARQLAHGAKGDLFLSADAESLDVVVKAGRVDGRQRPVALVSNSLVVIVPEGASAEAGDAGRPIEARKRENGGARAGDSPEAALGAGAVLDAAAVLSPVKRLAIADPVSVPAGRYARRWLESHGLWRTLEPRVVPAVDARAVVAAVKSGAAEAGIIYRTEALRAGGGVRVALDIPPTDGPEISYPAALLEGATGEARTFFARLCSEASRPAFEGRGFTFLACTERPG